MQRDLFGDCIPVTYAVDSTEQLGLFGGDAWMRFAEQWADRHGLAVVRMVAVGQRVQVAPGGWFEIVWEKDAGQDGLWDVRPCVAAV